MGKALKFSMLFALLALTGCFGDDKPRIPQPTYSPAGEPLVGGSWPKDCEAALSVWFDRVSPNPRGSLTLAALQAEAERQFHVMDLRHDGKLTAASLATYRQQSMGQRYGIAGMDSREWAELADDPNGSAVRRNRADKARDDFLANLPRELPDPVMSADTNLDGSVTWEEFRAYVAQTFAELDRKHAGSITKSDVQTLCGK